MKPRLTASIVSRRLSIAPSTASVGSFPNALMSSLSDTVASLSMGIDNPIDLGPSVGEVVGALGVDMIVGSMVVGNEVPIERVGE